MPYALVGGGAVSRSFVGRLPRLTTELGPVAAQSFRLASRISNTLNAGYPVRRWLDLAKSPVILISVAETHVGAAVSALEAAIPWQGRIAILCGVGDSSLLAPLQKRGASVSSLHEVESLGGRLFLVEGDPRAVRRARSLALELGSQVEESTTAGLPLFRAVTTMAPLLIGPLLESFVDCLMASGLCRTTSMLITQSLLDTATRAHRRSGQPGWRRALADRDPKRLHAVIANFDVGISQYFEKMITFGQARYSPALASRNRAKNAASA